MADSIDKRIPSFIQFTDTNLNKRSTKRRSARLEKVIQKGNKKRKKIIQPNSPSRRNPIQLDESNSNIPCHHRQIASINNNSNVNNAITVPMKKVCDVLGHSDRKPVPITIYTNADIKENDDGMLSHHRQITPISTPNNTNVVLEMTSNDLLSHQQKSPPIKARNDADAVTEEIASNHHNHHQHNYWTSVKETKDAEPLPGCSLSKSTAQMKFRKSALSTATHSQDFTFETITLSPDHDRQNIILPPLQGMTTMNVPQKSAAGMAQQPLSQSNRTTRKTKGPSPKPTTIRDIETPSPILPPSSSPSSSPITAQKQPLASSLWPSNSPSLERLDKMSSPEPSEFYSPSLELDINDDHQQAIRRNPISRNITSPTSDDAPFLSADDMDDDDSHRLDLDKAQNDTSGWAATLGVQGFFDRIKTMFG
ncbi:hypothetical protein BCR42DRAFT_127813 [Absidia repens]|uniref:Uncharacterized protein n=1 Tax=Absidia repens TaxID=90262 RepID=A0A1X2IVG3_9FUNG|nr:hypothetical protein BCR42DRAFT_127813 [Absidia repens]